jgi:hypothetical protein
MLSQTVTSAPRMFMRCRAVVAVRTLCVEASVNGRQG